MQCAVLGSLEVRGDDGAAVTVPGAKERYLLALLAAAFPASVSVDQLLESLWDGAPPRTGRKSLQAHVVRLRTALEPGRPTGSPGRYVVRRHDGYALAIDREQLDATQFADLAARGRALLAAGDVQAADDLLREALDLWRGRPYGDWPDSVDLDAERERLEAIRTHAIEAYWEAELALGRHAEAAPELGRLTREEPLQEAWWALHALALYRCGRQADALETLRNARRVLDEQLGVEPGVRLRELEQAILDQDPELDVAASSRVRKEPAAAPAAVTVTGCPYKGLAHYEPDDAPVFRGRDRLIRTLVTALVDRPLLVVSGSSGAGKSSVIRAGLLPALSAGALPSSDQWEHVVVVPGRSPVDALAPLTGEDPPAAPVVLVCDQLEQLWSGEVTSGERTAFLDTVLGLLSDKVVARCLLVVRGDHVGRLAEHPDVAQRLHGALVMVPPMTETELREVVEEPAHVASLSVEPDLTDLAVRDVLGRSGALPLLSTALAETWQRRRDGTLTLAGYLASGGVTGAVARSAETAYASLSEPGRELARRILVRLAEQDEHGTLRARRLPVAELALVGADPAVADEVIETLTARRLLARHDDRLEVTHEALLSAWPRLSTWLADDAVGRSVRRHLAPAALEWDANGRPEDELYRGTRLEAAAQWAADPDSAPTEIERAFVEASVARAEAELALARFRAQVEAAGRRRVRRLAAVLAVALVVALVSAAVAVGFQRTAAHRANEARAAGTVADANRLAAQSSSARALDLSLLLAVAAVRTADTPATRDSLLDALSEHRRATGVHRLTEEGIEKTALSADGRTLAMTIISGVPRVLAWNPGSPEAPSVIAENWHATQLALSPRGDRLVGVEYTEPEGDVSLRAYTTEGERLLVLSGPRRLHGFPADIAFTPQGRLLMFTGRWEGGNVGYRGALQELDVETGRIEHVADVGRTGNSDDFVTFEAAFTADASALVAWAGDGSRAYWVRVPHGQPVPLKLEARPATSLGFVATPAGALQLWSDGAVTRYDTTGQAAQVLEVHRAPVRDAAVLPHGRAAVTSSDGGQVELWSIDQPSGVWSLNETLAGHAGTAEQIEVSPDGRSLMTAGRDGQLITWDLTEETGFGSSYPTPDGRWVSNRIRVVEPGRLVVAPTRTRGPSAERGQLGQLNGPDTLGVAAVFIDPRDGRVLDEVPVGDNGGAVFGSSVAVSPDRRLVAVTSQFAVTVLDAETRRRVARIRLPLEGALFVWCAEWSVDGSQLLLGTEGDGVAAVLVVDRESWQVVDGFQPESGSAQVMEWSPDRSTLAIGVNYSETIDLYDADLKHLRTVKVGPHGDTFDLAFSPDGRYLAAGRAAGGVTVLDTRSWRLARETATTHTGHVNDVEWLPDSSTVVSTGRDGLISFYDVERDLVRASPLRASDATYEGQSFFLPDPDDEVVVLNDNSSGHTYPLNAARWLALACDVAGRDLTHAEWDRYLPGTPYRRVCDLD
jgi:WD40 repeat protein/DNA-binding SARP family transcriptional activator